MHRLLALIALTACAPESAPSAPTGEAARSLAASASDDDFAVPMNDVIERHLGLWTTERRDFVERALAAQADVAPTIDAAIARHGLPTELFAVAFVESGFQDIPARPEQYPAAGVWQFIPATARTYGLRVDDATDERRDLPKSTDAALRLLADLHAEFGDWGLAFAGYNQGSARVREAIEAEGTDDAWELVGRGALNPYAADVMSAVIVLENAEALGF